MSSIPRGPQTARTEPNNQRDMMRALTNPRSRVFLVFLDGAFVDDLSARSINVPLAKFLTTQLGDDDLVGVMTPTMSAKEVTFGRKMEVLAGGLPTQSGPGDGRIVSSTRSSTRRRFNTRSAIRVLATSRGR